MRLLLAFLRLVRWPNLVFIAITQILFVYCVVHPIFKASGVSPNIHGRYFIFLLLASVLIAAAGYIINDYFDLNIDRVNKPDKLVVEKIIRRRWVIFWHLLLSFAGVAFSAFIDLTSHTLLLSVSNFICVILLFIYSVSLKKQLLTGNIVISLLTAWVILVVTWSESSNLLKFGENFTYIEKVTRITFLYSGFAFVISLIREVIKDMEDVEGDRKYGCRTMPILWGINVSKVFVAVWLVVLIAVLCVVQFYVLQFKWWLSSAYCILFIIIPLVFIFRKLFSASTSKDFHQLSSWVKIVMFTGILSMLFFRVYL